MGYPKNTIYMNEKFIITKDGKKCKIEINENSKGIKVKTKGEGCKKLLGKDYFKEIGMEIPEE